MRLRFRSVSTLLCAGCEVTWVGLSRCFVCGSPGDPSSDFDALFTLGLLQDRDGDIARHLRLAALAQGHH